MFFITLVKWKRAPKKEDVDQFTKTLEELETQGIKMRTYWTLGRYDGLSIIEDRSISITQRFWPEIITDTREIISWEKTKEITLSSLREQAEKTS